MNMPRLPVLPFVRRRLLGPNHHDLVNAVLEAEHARRRAQMEGHPTGFETAGALLLFRRAAWIAAAIKSTESTPPTRIS